ncbi:ribbon-helix-helix domain-containing protein [Pseudoalteromonas luteoviolacea]|uniref:ribbon-helix-helix domain-containing protein n=1 Tax=Pseudoalteromonas luteoviolacea TaxID=43657 RepID=UPI0007B0B272|nr:ribbon-helix-helix domain-containing protein [Pseudoalteromonas luteoviolacea]MBQ4876114.1 ribbon-helix-helix domain-containing protein [Pseudoalteromonas luteoviolacea]MBQ4905749.1 ribbon-helix-helix domain-containing protein [Pseudoalteromonas luteoviolacea]
MCELYASQTPELYQVTKKSIRIQGVVTSLALENKVWRILEKIAAQEHTTLAQFISTLYQESIERHGTVTNLASLLRISCLTYLENCTE